MGTCSRMAATEIFSSPAARMRAAGCGVGPQRVACLRSADPALTFHLPVQLRATGSTFDTGAQYWHTQSHTAAAAALATNKSGTRLVIVDQSLPPHQDLPPIEEVELSVAVEPWTLPLSHATDVALVAAANGSNTLDGRGVTQVPMLLSAPLLRRTYVLDVDFGHTFAAVTTANAVLVCSFGVREDGPPDGPGISHMWNKVHLSMHDFARTGRNGLGGVLIFAAGNNRSRNGNDDGFLTHPATITVGAVDATGASAPFSTPFSALDVAAAGVAMQTRTGAPGVSGTSYAAPIVAAVAEMVVGVRPELSARDVRLILQTTADVPPTAATARNAAGYWHTPTHGFGIVNAARAVEAARTWRPWPPAVEVCTAQVATGGGLPPLGTNVTFVERVRLYVHADVTPGTVATLVAPTGTRTELLRNARGVRNQFYASYAFFGEPAGHRGWALELTGAPTVRAVFLCVYGVPGTTESARAVVTPYQISIGLRVADNVEDVTAPRIEAVRKVLAAVAGCNTSAVEVRARAASVLVDADVFAEDAATQAAANASLSTRLASAADASALLGLEVIDPPSVHVYVVGDSAALVDTFAVPNPAAPIVRLPVAAATGSGTERLTMWIIVGVANAVALLTLVLVWWVVRRRAR